MGFTPAAAEKPSEIKVGTVTTYDERGAMTDFDVHLAKGVVDFPADAAPDTIFVGLKNTSTGGLIWMPFADFKAVENEVHERALEFDE